MGEGLKKKKEGPMDPPLPHSVTSLAEPPTISRFFPFLAPIFDFFLGGSSRGIVPAGRGMDHKFALLGSSGSFCETPVACRPPGRK